MSSQPALSIRSTYAVGSFSLDAQLDVGAETVALIGPNGSGKSTLLLATLGIRTPTRGRIALGSRVVFDSEAKIDCPTEERHMAYLPQDFGLFPFLTAVGNVEFAIACAGTPAGRRRRQERAMAYLEQFGIGHLAGRGPHQLSGGERQRVALARAIASEPRALLLDEPTASLDVGARADVRALLQELFERLQIPTLIVTHDAGDIAALASRVAVMEAGRIVGCASAQEAVRHPANAFADHLLNGLRPDSNVAVR